MPTVSVLMIIPITFLFLVAFFALRRNEKHKISKRLPSGNMSLPFIGETFSFLKLHSLTTVGEFMEHRMTRFGKIFSSHLFGNLTMVSADPELNLFVLKNDGKLFGNGLSTAFTRVVGENPISLMVGDEHKHMRSTIFNFLSAERLKTIFMQDADHLASQILSSWQEGEVISAAAETTKFSLYIMVKKMLSMDFGDPAIERLPLEYDLFIRAFACFPLYIPGTVYWKALKSREYIIKIFKKEMEVRMGGNGCRNDEKDEDLLGWLIKNTDYSSEKIYDYLLGILFAGHDTTSRAMSLLIYFLESCPEAVKQLRLYDRVHGSLGLQIPIEGHLTVIYYNETIQEEHLQVVRSKQQGGESKLTWDDFRRTEFTRCVINETLRLGNIARFTLRRATADIEYQDNIIPRGSTVLLHFTAVHLDPCRFEDPERFNPWRWLTPSGIKVHDSFMPFGKGGRMCPGAELARLEMTVFLHHLVLKYDWELAEPDHPVLTPLIEFPKGLPITVRAISMDSYAS